MGERKRGLPVLRRDCKALVEGAVAVHQPLDYSSSCSGTDARSDIGAEKQEDSESNKSVGCEITTRYFSIFRKNPIPTLAYKPYICYYRRLEYDVLLLCLASFFFYLLPYHGMFIFLVFLSLCSSHPILPAGAYQVLCRMIVVFFLFGVICILPHLGVPLYQVFVFRPFSVQYFYGSKGTLFSPSVCDFSFELPCTSVESYARLSVKRAFHFFLIMRRRHVSRTRYRCQVFTESRSSQQVPRLSYCCTKSEKGDAVRIEPRPPSPNTCRLCARSLRTLFRSKRAAPAPGCRACSASPEHRVDSIDNEA